MHAAPPLNRGVVTPLTGLLCAAGPEYSDISVKPGMGRSEG